MSNCDSDGVPVDHDGERLEDYVTSTAPFAVSGAVFREMMAEKLRDLVGGHSEAEALGAPRTVASTSGGIPIQVAPDVTIEDYYSSDEPVSPIAVQNRCRSTISSTVHAVLRTSKHERDELYNNRRKLADALKFLKSKGFCEEDILKEQMRDGFVKSNSVRDEFGLPVLQKKEVPVACNSFEGNPKPVVNADKVFDEMPSSIPGLEKKALDSSVHLDNEPPKDPFKAKLKGKLVDEAHTILKEDGSSKDSQERVVHANNSWARVVKKDIPSVNFQFFPKEKGAAVVDPPDEVLIKGNEKFKNFVVGTFSKGTHSFKTVSAFVLKFWKHRGLVSVHQKDPHTFLFKFADNMGVFEVLSRGTWYVDRRPMIVSAWGHKPGTTVINHMPLWVKFSNLPDSYWTEEGLSRIASVIGEPLGADEPTSKLDVLPFAKMQVRYTLGDPLPSDISVSVLDPVTKQRSVAKVLVSYPVRPLYCTGCQSLGHSVSACPKITRVWKVKEQHPIEETKTDSASVEMADPKEPPACSTCVMDVPKNVSVAVDQPDSNPEGGWTEVKRKKQCYSPDIESPSPPANFKNLKKVDEIEEKKGNKGNSKGSPSRLTRSQKKKLRASQGSPPSSLS